MLRSFSSRIAGQLLLASLIAVIGVFLARDGATALASTFAPTDTVSLNSTAPSFPADTTITFSIPAGDSNFANIVTFTPSAAFIAPGPGHPAFSAGTDPGLGDLIGSVSASTTLGLVNGPCNTNLPVPFTLINATVDNSAGNLISPLPASSGDILEPMFTDDGTPPIPVAPVNGLPARVDLYSSYLNTIFTPDGGSPVQPLARYTGATIVGGSVQVLEVLIFEPGALSAAFDPPHPYDDLIASLGYPMVSILNDPVDPAGPSATTDVCTPITSSFTLLGQTQANTCFNNQAVPPCDTAGGINAPASGGSTGLDRYRNPSAPGTYIWNAWFQSLRDADGDGIENQFDTCPFTFNVDGDPRATTGPDGDMIDSACDPTPVTDTGAGNHDSDFFGTPLTPWLNAGDNCPLIANDDQADDEINQTYLIAAPDGGPKTDGIGDVCDPNPTTADTEGHYHVVCCSQPISIGATDSDGDGWSDSDEATLGSDPGDTASTPEDLSLVIPMPIANSGAGGGPTGEPFQICNDGVDNDLDGNIDLVDDGCDFEGSLPVHPGFPSCPQNGCSVDTDGDGFTDEAEMKIGTDVFGRCGPGSEAVSAQWPIDLDGSTLIPLSVDRISITDIVRFLAPVNRLLTSPGNPAYDPRFDLIPGKTFPFTTWIALNDLVALLAGPPGFPPMFGGVAAFNGGACTAHPQWGD